MGSKDIRIQNTCDHRLIFEVSELDSDRKTLKPEYPLGSARGLEVTRFGYPISDEDYKIVTVDDGMYGKSYKHIVLLEPDPYPDPVYELSYNATLEFCPKCLGNKFMDDIAIDNQNEVSIVTGAHLLIQEVEKAIVTTKASNPYYKWIGSRLSALVGTKITDLAAIYQEAESAVRSSLELLKNQQLANQEVNPLVSSDEILGNVEKVTVEANEEDSSLLEIYVQYTSQSGNSYEYGQLLDLTQYRIR